MQLSSLITPGCRGREIKKVDTEARFYVILINGINALISWNLKKWFGAIRERARLNFEILTSKIFKPILKSLLLSNDFENKLMMLLKN